METKTKYGIATLGTSAMVVIAALTVMMFAPPAAGETLITINAPTGNLYPGDYLDVTIQCSPTEPVKAWECWLHYDPQILEAVSVTEGTFFSPFQTFFNQGIINSSGGYIKDIYSLVVGVGNKTTSGTLVTIRFIARTYGSTNLNLTNVGVTNETMYLPIAVTNSSLRVWSPYDMNLDATVNLLDLIDVSNYYGQSGLPGWIKEDVNDDGLVNILDLVLVSSHWGEY